MKKYQCYGRVVGSKFLGEVEAGSAAEAIEKAFDLPGAQHISICHQCAREIEDPEITDITVNEDA
jgi:hypothetical protein